MASEHLTRILGEAGIEHEFLAHAHTETASDEAKALGLARLDVGKTLVLTTASGNVRAVLPASERLDLRKVRELLGLSSKQVRMASEDDLGRDYPEFELGAVPPFGGERRDPVIVDRQLAEREWVVCEAGSHEESLRLRAADLIQLTDARIAEISQD